MNAITRSLAATWRYARWCPLLFALPIAVEVAQHAAEMRLGFYDSAEAMRAAEHAPLRTVLGHAKVLVLFATGWWVARFLVLGSARAAARLEPRALRTFAPVMLWGLFWLVLLQDVLPAATAAGAPARPVAIATVAVLLGSMAFEPLLSAWKVAAAVGNPAIGFLRSIRLVRPRYGWALGVSLAAMLPPMVAHYALAFAAIGRGTAAVAAIMAADSLLVGVMGAAMSAANWVIAQAVAERAGVAIAPAAAPAQGQALAPA